MGCLRRGVRLCWMGIGSEFLGRVKSLPERSENSTDVDFGKSTCYRAFP